MHYSAGPARKYPLTANLRAHTLSVRSPQPRYIVRGTKGTFTKFGVDVQEEQLKALSNAIFKNGFGREPESLWGTVENIEADEVSVRRTVYVYKYIFWILRLMLCGYSRWPSTDPGAQIGLFRDLASAIRNGSELAVKWEEATAVIEIIQLAHLSAREGRTVDVPKK
jgi:predicted dehydrogenase